LLSAFKQGKKDDEESLTEKMDRLIEIQLNKHGWYKTELLAR
jgi:hypothetical protein